MTHKNYFILMLLAILCQAVKLAKNNNDEKKSVSSFSHHTEQTLENLNGDVRIVKKEEVSNNGKSAHYTTVTHKKNGKIEEERTEGNLKKLKKLKRFAGEFF